MNMVGFSYNIIVYAEPMLDDRNHINYGSGWNVPCPEITSSALAVTVMKGVGGMNTLEHGGNNAYVIAMICKYLIYYNTGQ